MASLGDVLVGRYRLDALIGVGGFATVFRAHDVRLERDVALKVLLPNHAADPLVVARFDREARALAAFSHPNVVGIHDVEPAEPSVGQEPFLVMDLCEGGSLAEQLEAGGKGVAPDLLVPILVDVAAGLDALHDAGMVHRDVKPSNVLLSGGRALIADLGIVAIESGDLTASSEAIGTLAFLAPEQLTGSSATPASDVHALGVVAYLGLTGRLPRPAGSVAELVAASAQVPPPVSTQASGLGTVFDRPIASALSPEPAQRPTVSQLGLRLERGLERWGENAAIIRTSVAGRSVPPLVGLARDPQSEPSPDDPTVIAIPPPTTKPLAPSATPSPPASSEATLDVPARRVRGRDPGRRPLAVLGAVLIGLVAIAVLAIVLSVADESPGPASPAAAVPRASPTNAPSPSPATTTTAIPTTAASYALALEASRAMHAAIAAARGRAGLNGREVKTLDGPLGRFDRALDARDAAGARAMAADLADAVRALVEAREVSSDAGARLLDAAEELVAAADDLPD